jgi:hypothetical protein
MQIIQKFIIPLIPGSRGHRGQYIILETPGHLKNAVAIRAKKKILGYT